jgi:hypothetical protein
MNNKGQRVIFGGMMFLLGVMMVLLLSTPLKDLSANIRDSDHLDCENDTVTTGVALSCVAVDLILPYFLIVILMVGGSYMFYRGTQDSSQ